MNTKKANTIAPTIARRLAITRQRLAGPSPKADSDGIMEVVKDLGCLQIDPIRAVERTQLLVLWSRLGVYDPAELDKLLWKDRSLFEYWAHAASIILTEDYPIYQVHMSDWAVAKRPWMNDAHAWVEANAELRDYILAELTNNGPLSSRDFDDHSEKNWESGGWTAGQNINQMLSNLWLQGLIMVWGRKGLQKLWDLSDRCLPAWTPRQSLSWSEVVSETAQRSLRALGVATQTQIEKHFTRNRYPDLKEILDSLELVGRIHQIQIVDQGERWPGTWFIHDDDLPLLERLKNGDWLPRTRLLSPFDNLICDRDRTESLFDFHYRIEIYVPKAKRKFGYYVLPILHGDRLIGRIDPKMDRKKKRLDVNRIYAEEDAPMTAETGKAIAGVIEELAYFIGAKEITYREPAPAGWRKILQ